MRPITFASAAPLRMKYLTRSGAGGTDEEVAYRSCVYRGCARGNWPSSPGL